MTDDDIVALIVVLLHLAYRRNLGDSDTLLHRAQMQFVDEIDKFDRKDEP